jgi:hypothetical protein
MPAARFLWSAIYFFFRHSTPLWRRADGIRGRGFRLASKLAGGPVKLEVPTWVGLTRSLKGRRMAGICAPGQTQWKSTCGVLPWAFTLRRPGKPGQFLKPLLSAVKGALQSGGSLVSRLTGVAALAKIAGNSGAVTIPAAPAKARHRVNSIQCSPGRQRLCDPHRCPRRYLTVLDRSSRRVGYNWTI